MDGVQNPRNTKEGVQAGRARWKQWLSHGIPIPIFWEFQLEMSCAPGLINTVYLTTDFEGDVAVKPLANKVWHHHLKSVVARAIGANWWQCSIICGWLMINSFK